MDCLSLVGEISSSPVSARKSANETTKPPLPAVRAGVFGELDKAPKPFAVLGVVRIISADNELDRLGATWDV